MAQGDVWEREYRNPQLITLGSEPRADIKQYIKFLRKEEGVFPERLAVLDLGSGTGKHSNYFASLGSVVTGYEISPSAIEIARTRAKELDVHVDYQLRDIGKPHPLSDASVDLVVDVLTSNSLSERERDIYLKEVARVLKPGGYFFVRALCKDGDKHAKNLLKLSPGSEPDTYINKDMGLTERVFSKDDFISLYSKCFAIQKLFKKENYAQFKGRPYKRCYWIAYLKKT